MLIYLTNSSQNAEVLIIKFSGKNLKKEKNEPNK